MAEEAEQPFEGEQQGEQEEEVVKEEQKYKGEDYSNAKCNVRIEELSKPNKMHVKETYKVYRKLLPDRNIKAVLLFLREEYAKTPEETELKFNAAEHKYKVKTCRKLCVREARKQHFAKMNENKRKNMLNILKDILTRYIARAYFSPKQIIMTTRLRRVSNTILKELCNLKGISVPKREATSIRSQLMFSTADFFAYCIDMIYYELQVQKITDYENLKRQKEILAAATDEELAKKVTKASASKA